MRSRRRSTLAWLRHSRSWRQPRLETDLIHPAGGSCGVSATAGGKNDEEESPEASDSDTTQAEATGDRTTAVQAVVRPQVAPAVAPLVPTATSSNECYLCLSAATNHVVNPCPCPCPCPCPSRCASAPLTLDLAMRAPVLFSSVPLKGHPPPAAQPGPSVLAQQRPAASSVGCDYRSSRAGGKSGRGSGDIKDFSLTSYGTSTPP